jgi:hypothetical protein
MEPPDAVLALQREVERRAAGRADLVPFVAWLRTRLDVLAAELTPAHRTPASSTKPLQVDRSLN